MITQSTWHSRNVKLTPLSRSGQKPTPPIKVRFEFARKSSWSYIWHCSSFLTTAGTNEINRPDEKQNNRTFFPDESYKNCLWETHWNSCLITILEGPASEHLSTQRLIASPQWNSRSTWGSASECGKLFSNYQLMLQDRPQDTFEE